MTAASRRLELTLLRERLAVCRLAPDTATPSWAAGDEFYSITRSAEELSVVVEESRVPAGVRSHPGLRVFQVRGPFAFSEIGVLSSLTGPLAAKEITLFAISAFDTDYLLVPEKKLAAAIAALEQAGHTLHRSHNR
jgi:uncharacterized protein